MRALAAITLAIAGCSLATPSDDALMGACRGAACDASAVPTDASADPTVVAWLATQRGGYCATRAGEAVALCVSASPLYSDANEDGIFCFDDRRNGRAFLRRPYPRGIALDVGFHWDGTPNGNVITLGSSDWLSGVCDPSIPGRRIEIGIDAHGVAWAGGPETAVIRDQNPLARGTHLVSYRVTTSENAFFIDGRLVGRSAGTGGITVEFPERWAPGFVLGAHNQRWWDCSASAPNKWLRMAGFFVHLRDDVVDPLAFDAQGALSAGDATVLLFEPGGTRVRDAAGVLIPRWFVTAGAGVAAWTAEERLSFSGRAYGPVWSDDVWADCLVRE